jgi:hypothetical protein
MVDEGAGKPAGACQAESAERRMVGHGTRGAAEHSWACGAAQLEGDHAWRFNPLGATITLSAPPRLNFSAGEQASSWAQARNGSLLPLGSSRRGEVESQRSIPARGAKLQVPCPLSTMALSSTRGGYSARLLASPAKEG